MLYVFDLDGTLIESEYAVAAAYRHAGITMPPGAWGKPVGTWCTPAQHAEKQRAYPEMLRRYATEGRALPLWHSVPAAHRCVVTGASMSSAIASMEFLGLDPHELAVFGADHLAKAEFIRTQMTGDLLVLYVDTDYAVAKKLWEQTRCAIVLP